MIRTLLAAVQQQRGTGYIHVASLPSTPPLSQLIGVTQAALPPSASVRSPLVAPKNQSATNSCLGMSIAQGVRTSYLKRGVACPELSGLFNYKLGRAAMGLEDLDNGMGFDAGLTAAVKFGLASEEAWPFALLRVNTRPSGTAFHDAYDRRGLRGYYQIAPSDIDGVRSALAAGICVLGAWAVDRMFQLDTGPVLIDPPISDIIGNHAMVVEGYAPDGTFGILNHYGDSWRSGGRARFTEQYMKASLGFIALDVGASP